MPHVLIVDDQLSNINVLGMLLENMDITYSWIQDPQDIEDMLENVPSADVVFLDLEFPNMDGFTLLNSIKRDEQSQNVPVIAYSVHTSEIDAARRVGFDGFVGKPLDAHKFPEIMQRILNNEAIWEVFD